jgi:2-keto-3-deoxy-L-rhamnonate aldolase RhmA
LKPINVFREKMRQGQLCLGTGVTFCDPLVTEAVADDVDFLWYDLEHCPMSQEALNAHLMAARLSGVPSVVRVAAGEIGFIKPALDSGAEGILVPQIKTAEEVARAVEYCRYRPAGQRGIGPRVPMRYGREDLRQFVAQARDDVFVAVMIENQEALDDLEQIINTPGLDSVVIGPTDLSDSLGVLGRLDGPEITAAVKKVVTQAQAKKLFVGAGLGPDRNYGKYLADLGVQWLQVGSDCGYLVNFVGSLLHDIRAATSSS